LVVPQIQPRPSGSGSRRSPRAALHHSVMVRHGYGISNTLGDFRTVRVKKDATDPFNLQEIQLIVDAAIGINRLMLIFSFSTNSNMDVTALQDAATDIRAIRVVCGASEFSDRCIFISERD